MKAYINKGTKIKWENSPSAPEFTDERIKQAVDAYFPVSSAEPEQGDFLLWDEDHGVWAPHTLRLNDNTDVTVYEPDSGQILIYDTGEWGNVTPTLNIADDVNITTPAEGDTLVYDATAGEWKNVPVKVWEELPTITADGSTPSYEVSLPEGTTAIELRAMIKGDADGNAALRTTISFDGTTYTSVGYSTNFFTTSDRWGSVYIASDCGQYITSTLVTSALGGNGALNARSGATVYNTSPLQKIRFENSAGDNIPADSTFTIYAKH